MLAVVAGVGAVSAGAVRGGLPDAESTVPQAPLPEGPITAEDLSACASPWAFAVTAWARSTRSSSG